MKEEKSLHHVKGSPMSLVNSTKNFATTMSKTNMEMRHQSLWRGDERKGETDLQRNHKTKWMHAWSLEESENKSVTQERWRGRCWKLPPECSLPAFYKLFLTIQKFFHDSTKRKIRRDSEALANNRPSCDVQNDWPEMPRVENQNVDSNNRLHEGIRLHHNSCGINHEYISLRPEGICTDRCREQHVRDQERNQTKWPSVKLAVQHSSTEFTERSHPALAKEKRNGNLPERPGPRQPHKPEVRRLRAAVRNVQRTASKNDVRIQG